MGVICNCNIDFIQLLKKEVSIDINNNKQIENETNEFTKLKLYFQSNEDNNKLSTQRSKKETLYDLIIRRLLEQNEPKKNHPK